VDEADLAMSPEQIDSYLARPITCTVSSRTASAGISPRVPSGPIGGMASRGETSAIAESASDGGTGPCADQSVSPDERALRGVNSSIDRTVWPDRRARHPFGERHLARLRQGGGLHHRVGARRASGRRRGGIHTGNLPRGARGSREVYGWIRWRSGRTGSSTATTTWRDQK
jgi:hypothetical protein